MRSKFYLHGIVLCVALTGLAPLALSAATKTHLIVEIERRDKVGDVIRRSVDTYPDDYDWFRQLPEADKKSVIDELNRYTVVLRQQVEQSNTPDGRKLWQFVGDQEPKDVSIDGDTDRDGRTKQIGVTVMDYNLVRAKDGAESKNCYFLIEWRLRPKRGLPLKELKNGEATGINTNREIVYMPVSALKGLVEITDQYGKEIFLIFKDESKVLMSDGGGVIEFEVEGRVMSKEQLFKLLNDSMQGAPMPTTTESK